MKAESAHNGVGGQNEKTLAIVHTVKLSVKPTVRQSRNLLTHIATNTFEFEDVTGIQLENGLVLSLEDYGNTDLESKTFLTKMTLSCRGRDNTSCIDNLV